MPEPLTTLKAQKLCAAHLIDTGCFGETQILSRGESGVIALSPGAGVLTLFLYPGCGASLSQSALEAFSLYQKAGLIRSVWMNGRAARLIGAAFPEALGAPRAVDMLLLRSEAFCPFPAREGIAFCLGAAAPSSDILELLRHAALSEGLPITETDIRRAAKEDCASALCLMKDGRAVAMARLMERHESTVRIGLVVTAPAYRGKGYGKAVVSRLAETILLEEGAPLSPRTDSYAQSAASARQCYETALSAMPVGKPQYPVLFVRHDNIPALRLYAALGFETVGTLTERTII